ncbi:GTP-binding protein Era-like-protein [Hippea maritima DSM 10411]|uniref:GTPase Era n=2 Tax=Hippea TaxID=84404 RepID=F2LUJ2_HIPMA|nr:GTP-binding protein Era-like-protein [Hippea maritima DSM 10411]
MFKSGFVAMIGKPNVGKSTLLNLLIGEKIAIVSPKPQATRKSVRGILNGKDYQIIFIDTPGVHESEKKLNQVMKKYIDEALEDFDLAVVITDNHGEIDEVLAEYLSKIKEKSKKAILIVNKTDLMNKEQIEQIKSEFTSKANFEKIIETSLIGSPDAKEKILEAILELLPEGPKYYEDDIISTETERFIIAEIIREKVMNNVSKEIPYHIAVTVEEMKYRQEKELYYIKANIIVERRAHKMIIIGEGGKKIKEIGKQARQEIEAFLRTKVYLELWVKIKEHWTKKEALIKEYIDPRF